MSESNLRDKSDIWTALGDTNSNSFSNHQQQQQQQQEPAGPVRREESSWPRDDNPADLTKSTKSGAPATGPVATSSASILTQNLIGNAMMMLISPVNLISDFGPDTATATCATSDLPILEQPIDASNFLLETQPQPQRQSQKQQERAAELERASNRSRQFPSPSPSLSRSRSRGQSQSQRQRRIGDAGLVGQLMRAEQRPPLLSATSQSQSQSQSQSMLTNARPKQKSTTTNQNKCASEEPTKANNENVLEANGLIATAPATTRSVSERTTELDESLTLAERKAKLKSDFFKDSIEQIHSKRTKSDCKYKGKKLLDTENILISLVAQRKLDLKRKFDEQLSIKSSTFNNNINNNSNNNNNNNNNYIITPIAFEELIQKFDKSSFCRRSKMIMNPNKTVTDGNPDIQMLPIKVATTLEQRSSPISDEGCNLGHSPYSSDNEHDDDDDDDNISIRTAATMIERSKHKDKVARSASSDSALGLDVDDSDVQIPTSAATQQRRMTLTVADIPLRPALLPLAEPTALPDSSAADPQQAMSNFPPQNAIPSKVLLEERVVEIPEEPRPCPGLESMSSSRRESAQSCISDYPNSECGGVRYVRTPSVVVSDYSDDVMCGITLEEIEYFRAHRLHRRRSSLDTANNERDADGHSDVSAASSCSNLYYCGSTISALDGSECYVNGVRTMLERKISDCSTCSISAGEDDDQFTIREEDLSIGAHLRHDIKEQDALAELMAAQHLSAALSAPTSTSTSTPTATSTSTRSRSTKKVGDLLTLPAGQGETRLN